MLGDAMVEDRRLWCTLWMLHDHKCALSEAYMCALALTAFQSLNIVIRLIQPNCKAHDSSTNMAI